MEASADKIAISKGTIIDRYQVEGRLGSGSMGEVYRAHDVDLKRQVAIKILSDEHRDNDELRARFTREARAVAAISHPNVVQVFTTGSFDGRPYIAMEFLRGVDLGTVLQDRGPMNSRQAATVVNDTAKGLRAAAQAGLIHRDIKPSNLVLLESGTVKVTDFGLAKPLDPGDEPALTAMGVVVGTPDYIAPEQARGETLDASVDVYALGGTAFHLLTGRPPFRTGVPAQDKYLKVVARHLKSPPPDPRSQRREVDGRLSELVLSMMAKKATERPSYDQILKVCGEIIRRLGTDSDIGSDSAEMPQVNAKRAETAQPAPTPFIGGRKPTLDGAHKDFESPGSSASLALTQVDKVAANSSMDMSSVNPPRWPRYLAIATALVFLAGLGFVLAGNSKQVSSKENNSTPTPDPSSAKTVGTQKPSPSPSPPKEILVPDEMSLIPASADHSAILVDRADVTMEELKSLFPRIVNSKKTKGKIATKVSFEIAVAYARAHHKRLPSPEEYQAIFSHDPALIKSAAWHWLDDGSVGTQSSRSVGKGKKLAKRPPDAQPDVGIRLVKDL